MSVNSINIDRRKSLGNQKALLAEQGALLMAQLRALHAAETQQRSDPGTLSTRTNDTSGTLTLGEGHAVPTGATVKLSWNGGQRSGTVGTVNGQSVPISGGSGDNLPAQSTAVTCEHGYTAAEKFGYHGGGFDPDNPVYSATEADASFAETASCIGNSAAFEQWCARHVQ